MTVLHLSDLHFGKPHRPAVSDALLRLAQELAPAVVVVSGDLTQRAKATEYRAAAAFLSRLPPTAPLVVVPGNHDVPLYRFWERLATPYAKYRRHISRELNSALEIVVPASASGSASGARFVALNSAAPRTAIVNGRLSRRQLRFAESAFASATPGAYRVLTLHHNLLRPGDDELGPEDDESRPGDDEPGPPPLHGASRLLERLDAWRVDLVLCGHIHRGWLAGHQGTPLVHAGTACSRRGRGRERGRNSVSLVQLRYSETSVVVYLYSEDAGRFLPGETSRHPRRSRPARDAAGRPPPRAGLGQKGAHSGESDPHP